MSEKERYMRNEIIDAELTDLCLEVKSLVNKRDWSRAMDLIPRYMELYPDSAVPHNLMGIVMESKGEHAAAMKHFRAAWALDSTYMPASFNMDVFADYDREKKLRPAYMPGDMK